MIDSVYVKQIKVFNTVAAVSLAVPGRLYNAAGVTVSMTVSFASTPFISALANGSDLLSSIVAAPTLYVAETQEGVTTTTLTGIGSGLTVDVTVANTGTAQEPVYEITAVASADEGDNYRHGDRVRVDLVQSITVDEVTTEYDCSFELQISESLLANKTATITLPANQMTPFEVVGFDVSGSTQRRIFVITE